MNVNVLSIVVGVIDYLRRSIYCLLHSSSHHYIQHFRKQHDRKLSTQVCVVEQIHVGKFTMKNSKPIAVQNIFALVSLVFCKISMLISPTIIRLVHFLVNLNIKALNQYLENDEFQPQQKNVPMTNLEIQFSIFLSSLNTLLKLVPINVIYRNPPFWLSFYSKKHSIYEIIPLIKSYCVSLTLTLCLVRTTIW